MLVALALALFLSVSPQQCFAPATLTIKVQVQPNEQNRLVRVKLESEDYLRSTDTDLEGERAPKTQPLLTYKMVPLGDYLLTATVFDSTGKAIHTATQVVHVIGM